MSYKFFNSIISTHRKRFNSLKVFLRSILISSKYVDKNSFEIIITDLGKNLKVDNLIASYSDKLNIKHCKVGFNGIFWKSKALNHCVLNSEGKYITMIDIDSLVPPSFLIGIKDFFSNPNMNRTKLCHRVRYLDVRESKRVADGNFNEEYIKKHLIGKAKKHRLAWERYTKNENKLRTFTKPQTRWFAGEALGNSHFTMKKKYYLEVGGYDERFVGWSCEDMDFNRRVFAYLGSGYLIASPKYTIFSVYHTRSDWMSVKNTKKNTKMYQRSKKNGVIKLPIEENWGVF